MIRSFTQIFAALVVLSIVAGPVSARDQAPAPEIDKRAEEAIRKGLEQIMRGLELFVDSIPQYELPKVLENGDIIIRRKRPKIKTPDKMDRTKT